MIIYGVDLYENGDRVVFNYRRDGEFEPASVAAWRAALRPGEVAIDVGSYSGLYAIMAAKAGCHAVAYEPNPTMFARLRDNVARNMVSVDCSRYAISDKVERRAFYTKHDMTSAGRFKPRNGADRIEVDCRPLTEKRKVCAIKIDVEGAEAAVLRGAAEVIVRDRPVVICEALTEAQREVLTAWMANLGYSWRLADKHNIVFTP